MTANIQTIFFDVGNTLRIVLPDQEFIDRAEAGLMELIGTTESHDALFAKLEQPLSDQEKLKELVGHTPLQVCMGGLLGILTGVLCNLGG